jgi:RNA polymerase sigma factor (sigma-70 family)
MDYKIYNDYELIDKIRENDEDSHSILFLKYQNVLHAIVHEYYSRFSNYGYDYDDFYQEAIISFYHALSLYDEKKDVLFYTFMILCVKRSLLSFCRNISRGDTRISSKYFKDSDDCVIEDVESDISMYMKRQEIQSIIREVIFDFPIDVSSILELHFNGFSYREIGTLLDIPTSTVEFKSRKARKLLISRVQNYCCK